MSKMVRAQLHLASLLVMAGCSDGSISKFLPSAPLDWVFGGRMERGPKSHDPEKVEASARDQDQIEASFPVSIATLYRNCVSLRNKEYKVEEGRGDCLKVGDAYRPIALEVDLPDFGNVAPHARSLPRQRLLRRDDVAFAGVTMKLPPKPSGDGMLSGPLAVDVVAGGFHFDISAYGPRAQVPMYLHEARLDVRVEAVKEHADRVEGINCDLELRWTNEPSQRRDVVGIDKDALADLKTQPIRHVAAFAGEGNSRWLSWPQSPKSAPMSPTLYAWSERQRTQMWLPHSGSPGETGFSADTGAACPDIATGRGRLCSERIALANLEAMGDRSDGRSPRAAVTASFNVTAAALAALGTPNKLVGFYFVPTLGDLRPGAGKKTLLKDWIDQKAEPPIDKARSANPAGTPYCMVRLRDARLTLTAQRLPADMSTHPTPRASQ